MIPAQLPPGWTDFHARHGWFADLALGNGLPDTNPERAVVLNAALRTTLSLILYVFFAFVAGAAGMVLLIVGLLLFMKGRLRTRFDRAVPLPADRSAYLYAFVIYLVGMIGLGLILRAIPQLSLELRSSLALPLAFFIGIAAPRVLGQSWSQWRAALGVHLGNRKGLRGLTREIAAGWVGYVAGLPVLFLGMIATLILIRISGGTASHPIMREMERGPGTVAILFFLAAIWAPVTEELMFRGALFTHLRQRFGWWISAPVVALIFAAIHPQGWAAIPAIAAIAIVLAAIREWRGSIIGCIAAHFLHNSLLVILLLLLIR